MINILVVDDQHIIRDGLISLLSSHPDMKVVGHAENGLEACESVRKLQPDVVLMDIRMPKMNGVEATKIIKEEFPNTKVIILTTFDDDNFILEAMRNGASGYLLKDIGSDKLYSSIIDSINGSIILPGEIAVKIVNHIGHEKGNSLSLDEFSEREMDIIHLLVTGVSNQEIASTLFLSVGTVKNYVSQIYSKIGCVDRANAILFFKEKGL